MGRDIDHIESISPQQDHLTFMILKNEIDFNPLNYGNTKSKKLFLFQ